MSTFDRREFLRRTSLSAGLAALPGWLTRGFSPQDGNREKVSERVRALRAARRRAVASGKPLLVFVVPAAEGEYWQRGEVLGSFLTHGDDSMLLDLAMCEPACATVAEVRDEIRPLELDGEPLMLLIEPEGDERPTARAIDPDLDEFRQEQARPVDSFEEWRKSEEERGRKRNAAVAAALHAVIAPSPAALAARADANRAQLAADDREALDSLIAGEATPSRDVVLRGAAVLRMAAEAPRKKGDRERILDEVASASRAEHVDDRLPGSKWARTTGCGVTIEGDSDRDDGMGIACGMAMTPPLSERLLYFFTTR